MKENILTLSREHFCWKWISHLLFFSLYSSLSFFESHSIIPIPNFSQIIKSNSKQKIESCCLSTQVYYWTHNGEEFCRGIEKKKLSHDVIMSSLDSKPYVWIFIRIEKEKSRFKKFIGFLLSKTFIIHSAKDSSRGSFVILNTHIESSSIFPFYNNPYGWIWHPM